ncbi:MAG: hypothetical protein N2506_00265 [Dehalococcoidales bacterium]|nr:hypothetical protein [Dehalococcoidales bacterium]
MRKLIRDRCSLALLRFFVAHPNGRFSKLAIINAIDYHIERPDIERALAQMVEEGILTLTVENSISFYTLTRNEPVRQIVMDLGEFGWRYWQLILEYV